MSDRSSEQSKANETAEQSGGDQGDNLAHAFSGAGGGLLSMALTYPLITLSTRAQVEKKKAQTGTLSAAKKIIDREGIPGLYAGMESALFGMFVTNFVYYYWYEFSKGFLQRTTKKSQLSTLESMAAGALAGSATVFITNPIWVVNTRMTARSDDDDDESLPTKEGEESKKEKSPSSIGTLMKIIKDDGFMRLFAGVLPALVLVLNPILQYTVYERLKQILEKTRKVGAVDSFVMGAIGKLVATTITYPYITVKSRAHVASGSDKSEGMIGSLRRIIRDDGLTGLYGGIGPKVSQSVLTAAFLFAFKDILYDMTIKARKKVVEKA